MTGLAIALLILQFFQPSLNRSDELSAAHIENVYVLPENVKAILVQSCYDCHSNNTRYPWYSRIQPGAWFMAKHIQHGKAEVNFSDFGEYSVRRRRSKFRAMSGQIKNGEMPLWSYTLMHHHAVLSTEDKHILMDWFGRMEDSIK
ncbi:heme-binding protein [Sphingobacterium paludis]|uniref:Heme-binding protein n=2 Tax=Sphingobacterium paludis TaxID=1476465 RepID=A0A4R7CTI5_9SPHI|nr:heme-binding protein [Sphingobacterium paludis]